VVLLAGGASGFALVSGGTQFFRRVYRDESSQLGGCFRFFRQVAAGVGGKKNWTGEQNGARKYGRTSIERKRKLQLSLNQGRVGEKKGLSFRTISLTVKSAYQNFSTLRGCHS